MARPQKFRHQREELTDPKVAEKLGRFVIEIEDLRSQRSKIDELLAAAFDAVDDGGFEKKYVRKVVALRAKEDGVRRDEEDGLESYEFAIEKGVSLARSRRKPANDQFDPLTGEFVDDGEADERRSDAGLSIVTKHTEITSSGGSSSAPSSLTTREAEESVVPHLPETANEMDRSTKSSFAARNGEAENARKAIPASPEDGSVTHAGAGEIPATNSEKATVATQGEATAPTSDERASLPIDDRSDAAANAGGNDVDGGAERATHLVTGEGAAKTALPANGVTMEYVPASGVKRLPFAHCFPELSKADYERLEKDIAANRVKTPITRQGDVIVDGWARYTISRTYGLSYPVQEYTGTDVLLDVIEWQRASRKFTPAQEKKIADDLAKEIPHRADDIFAAFGLAEALEAAQ